MKNIGIWLDGNKAHIISNNKIDTIYSEIEHFNIYGGSGTRLKGGPQDVLHDRRYLEREKHQLKKYFDTIVSNINAPDAIVIFGSAEVKDKFSKELQKNHSSIYSKVKDVVITDSMTNNQLIAWVRDYFS